MRNRNRNPYDDLPIFRDVEESPVWISFETDVKRGQGSFTATSCSRKNWAETTRFRAARGNASRPIASRKAWFWPMQASFLFPGGISMCLQPFVQ